MAQIFSFKSLSPVCTVSKVGREVLFAHSTASSSTPDKPSELSKFQTQYKDVFTIPTGLPPVRGKEHSITLVPGVSAVSVRPYRYPHASKMVMEQMVTKMLSSGIIQPSTSPFSNPVLLGWFLSFLC